MLTPAEILGPDGRIAARLEHYERRDEQLAMAECVAEAIAALGIRTAGALAAIPPGDIEQRWGPGGLAAWRPDPGAEWVWCGFL